MKLRFLALVIFFLSPALAAGADDADALLNKALDSLVRNLYVGDSSAAEGYLKAILERDPDHVEAQWQLLYIKLVPLKNADLSARSTALAALSPAFTRLAKIAKQTKKTAFLHFATAMHASFYHAFDRSLSEIDQAIALEPKSARYWTARGRILAAYGDWTKRDAEIEKGIADLKKARALLQENPSPFVRDEIYDFYLGDAVTDLTQPRWNEAVAYYTRFLDRAPPSTVYAFAANNLSIAYRRMGQCLKAKETADKALATMKFGMAQFNKRMAEFCIEMQKMGIIAEAGDKPALAASSK